MNKNSYYKEFLGLVNEIESDDEDNYNNQDEKDILSIDTQCIHNHYNEYQISNLKNNEKLFGNLRKESLIIDERETKSLYNELSSYYLVNLKVKYAFFRNKNTENENVIYDFLDFTNFIE